MFIANCLWQVFTLLNPLDAGIEKKMLESKIESSTSAPIAFRLLAPI